MPELLDDAAARGLRLAIVTTTSRANVAALLLHTLGCGVQGRFEAAVCGEDVAAKKPDPEAYALALRQLGLRPRQTLALEDSPAGPAGADARVALDDLIGWHARMDLVSAFG